VAQTTSELVRLQRASKTSAFNFDTKLRIKYDFRYEDHDGILLDRRARFRREFERQLPIVRRQLSSYKDRNGRDWLSESAPLPPRVISGPCQHPADFFVVVAPELKYSRALVPAWLGKRGLIESSVKNADFKLG
jgi:hypothetical protein